MAVTLTVWAEHETEHETHAQPHPRALEKREWGHPAEKAHHTTRTLPHSPICDKAVVYTLLPAHEHEDSTPCTPPCGGSRTHRSTYICTGVTPRLLNPQLPTPKTTSRGGSPKRSSDRDRRDRDRGRDKKRARRWVMQKKTRNLYK